MALDPVDYAIISQSLIAVAREMQGKKLGLRMIQALTQISEDVGCYKTILNCNENNIGTFYVSVLGKAVLLTFFFQRFTKSVVTRNGRSKW